MFDEVKAYKTMCAGFLGHPVDCCVELSTSRNTQSAKMHSFQISEIFRVFVHIKYTSNVATCYDNGVSNVNASHVFVYFFAF